MGNEKSDEPKRRRGRPTKFDQTVAANILKALGSGAWKKTAAEWAGIDYTTLKRWLKLGRLRARKSPQDPFVIFALKVKEATNGCEIRAGNVAYLAALKDPDIALRWLSVRHRKRWNPKQSIEVTGDAKKPIAFKAYDLKKVLDADLDRLEEIALRAAAPAPAPGGDSGGEGET